MADYLDGPNIMVPFVVNVQVTDLTGAKIGQPYGLTILIMLMGLQVRREVRPKASRFG